MSYVVTFLISFAVGYFVAMLMVNSSRLDQIKREGWMDDSEIISGATDKAPAEH